MKKVLSVIIPVYNGETYIDKFIKGITEQSIFNQLFIIFVDDGSSDHTYKKLKEYQCMYSENIRVFTKENNGVSSARNVGMEMIETPFYSFADIDDVMHERLFERLYQMIQETDADMVCAAIQKVTVEQESHIDTKNICGDTPEIKNLDSESAIRMLLRAPEQNAVYSKIYRTNTLGTIRFDERLSISEDKLFVFQCMMHSKKIGVSGEILYFYIQQPLSAMNYTNARKKLGQDIVIDIIDKEIKKNYPNSYPLCAAVRAEIHAGSFIKVYTNDKIYKDKCKYYRQSVCNCPLTFIFSQLKGLSRNKVLLVRFFPYFFSIIRIKKYKNLI